MEEYEKVKRTAEKIAKDADGAYEKAKEVVAKLTGEVTTKGQEVAAAAKERGGEMLEDVVAQGERAWKGINQWARKNPGAAIAGGVVLGVLILALFGRRSEED